MLTVFDVANFFIYLNKNDKHFKFDSILLNNIIYIASGWFSYKNDMELFDENLIAYNNGVYVQELIDKIQLNNDPIYEYIGNFDNSKYISIEIELLIAIYEYYTQFNNDEIKQIVCNKNSPWFNAINSKSLIVNKKQWKEFIANRKYFDDIHN